MRPQSPDLIPLLSDLTELITPGVLGLYSHFEATEIFAMVQGQKQAINVFTVLVAEDRGDEAAQPCRLLNSSRITLKSLKGWSFGVARYSRPIGDLVLALERLSRGERWEQSGKPLAFGTMRVLPRIFVAPDESSPVPLNRLLKNNFWNGSHVFEWFDREKTMLLPLLDDPRRLQALSEAIQQYVPIGLAAISDRLGNLVVQLPVTILTSVFEQVRGTKDLRVALAWHPNAIPRPVRATCDWEYDGVIGGYGSVPVQAPETMLGVRAGRGPCRCAIWDEQRQIILAATGPFYFIARVIANPRIADPEPRTFVVKEPDSTVTSTSIPLVIPSTAGVGGSSEEGDGGWTEKRRYKEELAQLAKERRFVQYRPDATDPDAGRKRALADVRGLIDDYGIQAAWLWDPFLSAQDLLETLFRCKYSGSELRALTLGKSTPSSALKGSSAFVAAQRAELNAITSNWRGLRLEYRIKRGSSGWNFHDRFLIFPRTDAGALAWSLGTSVNSLGTAHHILQRIDDGQLVMDAFVDLWDRLDRPEHLIWKKP